MIDLFRATQGWQLPWKGHSSWWTHCSWRCGEVRIGLGWAWHWQPRWYGYVETLGETRLWSYDMLWENMYNENSRYNITTVCTWKKYENPIKNRIWRLAVFEFISWWYSRDRVKQRGPQCSAEKTGDFWVVSRLHNDLERAKREQAADFTGPTWSDPWKSHVCNMCFFHAC